MNKNSILFIASFLCLVNQVSASEHKAEQLVAIKTSKPSQLATLAKPVLDPRPTAADIGILESDEAVVRLLKLIIYSDELRSKEEAAQAAFAALSSEQSEVSL